MVTLTFAIMILSGLVFIITIALMTPKGGIGFGVGGMTTSNEYGSKKSMEGTLKKSAIISIIIFTSCAILYPYMNKKQLATNTNISNKTNIPIKINASNFKVNSLKTTTDKTNAEPTKSDTNEQSTTNTTK